MSQLCDPGKPESSHLSHCVIQAPDGNIFLTENHQHVGVITFSQRLKLFVPEKEHSVTQDNIIQALIRSIL